MKKILVIILIAFSTGAFALKPANYKAVYKLNNETTFDGLIHYLNADKMQADHFYLN